MPKYVIKVYQQHKQVRLTIPKALAEELRFDTAAYALAWPGPIGCLSIRPLIDVGLLNEAIPGIRTKEDPGAEGPGSDTN